MNLEVFGFGKLQDFSTLLNMAMSEGVTDIRLLQSKIHDHISNKRFEVSVRKRKERKVRAKQELTQAMTMCAVCKSDQHPALVERVNICPSTMIGGKWKSSTSCTNPACLHVELSEKTVTEVVS